MRGYYNSGMNIFIYVIFLLPGFLEEGNRVSEMRSLGYGVEHIVPHCLFLKSTEICNWKDERPFLAG